MHSLLAGLRELYSAEKVRNITGILACIRAKISEHQRENASDPPKR